MKKTGRKVKSVRKALFRGAAIGLSIFLLWPFTGKRNSSNGSAPLNINDEIRLLTYNISGSSHEAWNPWQVRANLHKIMRMKSPYGDNYE